MRTLRLSWLSNPHVSRTAVLIMCILLYITFVVLIYLMTRSLYLLTTFIQFPLFPLPASGNQESDLFFYAFVCFCSVVDLNIMSVAVIHCPHSFKPLHCVWDLGGSADMQCDIRQAAFPFLSLSFPTHTLKMSTDIFKEKRTYIY